MSELNRPCVAPQYSARRQAAWPVMAGRVTASMIHIVDDDAGVRAALGFLLATVGMESRTYASAEALLSGEPPAVGDCLIVDLHMPKMSGVGLLQALQLRGIDVPAIVITAHPEYAAELHPLQRPPVAVLNKPFRDEALLRVLDKALGGG